MEKTIFQWPLKLSKNRIKDDKSELHWAAIATKSDQLRRLLDQDFALTRRSSTLSLLGRKATLDLSVKDSLGRTALHWVVALHRMDSFYLLLKDKRTPRDQQDNDGRTPLHEAAIRGFDDIICELLPKVEPLPNTTNTHRDEEVKFSQCQPDITDWYGWTPLHWAAENGNLLSVERLLEGGATASGIETPLHRASLRGHRSVVERLLREDPELALHRNKDGETPLHLALQFGDSDEGTEIPKSAINQLIDAASNARALINTTNNDGNTALHVATSCGRIRAVILMIERIRIHTGKTNIESTDHYTQMLWAAENGHEAIVRLLLDNGARFESEDNFGQTPLLLAAQGGHEAVVQLLLDKGAKFDYEGEFGNPIRTPLSWAAGGGYFAVVQQLLKKGANVESISPGDFDRAAGDDDGCRTPLSYAAEGGHEAVVRLLLDNNADVESEDNMGRTPLRWAANEAVRKLLKSQGVQSS